MGGWVAGCYYCCFFYFLSAFLCVFTTCGKYWINSSDVSIYHCSQWLLRKIQKSEFWVYPRQMQAIFLIHFFFPVTTMNKSLLIFWQDYSCLWVIFSRQWTTVFWCKLAWICSRQTLSIFSNREFGWERQFREKENVSLQPIGYNKSHMALQILLATSKYIGHFYRE